MSDYNNLLDLFGQDLAGWKLTTCYYLEIDSPVSSSLVFAVNAHTLRPIIVEDKSLLRIVWDRIDKHYAKVGSIAMIANSKEGIAFAFNRDYWGDSLKLKIYSAEELDSICKDHQRPFKWERPVNTINRGPIKEPDFS